MKKCNVKTEDIVNYSIFTETVFEYIRNWFNGPARDTILFTYSFDPINHNIGGCAYPQVVTIYIGEILSMFSENDRMNFKTFDGCVKTVITHTIIHELLHANKIPDMNEYLIDVEAHLKEEEAIDRQSILIEMDRMNELKLLFGFEFRLDVISGTVNGPYSNNGYQETPLDAYYMSILCMMFPNIHTTGIKDIFSTVANIDISIVDNCIINIKQNGEFVGEPSLKQFIDILTRNTINRNSLSYIVTISSSCNNATIQINFRGGEIDPMIIKS